VKKISFGLLELEMADLENDTTRYNQIHGYIYYNVAQNLTYTYSASTNTIKQSTKSINY
jgi:hypothetical protein